MSRRFYDVLGDWSPIVEPYSIDEMFVDFAGFPGDLAERAAAMRADVRRRAKIPTCVGIGPTKTIAKLANKVAKIDRAGPGVVNFTSADVRAAAYETLSLGEVWGLGRQSQKKLAGQGVTTIAAFVTMPPDLVRDILTVTGLRTHAELRGISCMAFADAPSTRKSIACTRSFGRTVTTYDELREAVATYTARAAEKLRRFNLRAGAMQVFVRTNEFNNDPKYSNQATIEIEPSADSMALIASATRALRGIWQPGFRYAKAGVILLDLYKPDELPTADLFASRDPERSRSLMTALDAINGRYGRETVRPGGTRLKKGWAMRRANLSPCYTTRLDDLMPVLL